MLDEVRVAEIENRANYCLRAYRGATILNCANDCLDLVREVRELSEKNKWLEGANRILLTGKPIPDCSHLECGR